MKTLGSMQQRRIKLIAGMVILSFTGYSQTHVTMSMQNCSQPSSNTIQFDLYIVNDGTTALKFNGAQFGINYDPAILNGGTITTSVVNNSWDIIVVGGSSSSFSFPSGAANHVRIVQTGCIGCSGSAPSMPTNVPLRFGTFILTNSQPWAANSQPNFTLQSSVTGGKTICATVVYIGANTSTTSLSTTGTDRDLSINCSLTLNACVTSNAGPDQALCNMTTATLAGNLPAGGSGTWSVLSGTGIVNNISSPNSTVSNLSDGDNIFRWTLTIASCPQTTDDVSIHVDATAAASNAGVDQCVCNPASFALSANAPPSPQTGIWSVITGIGNFVNPNDPSTNVTGMGIGVNIYRWTIANGICESTDEVEIKNHTAVPAAPLMTVFDSAACPGDTNTYAISAVPNSCSYLWYDFYNSGNFTFLTPVNGTSVDVLFQMPSDPNTSGYRLHVVAVNGCGQSSSEGIFIRRLLSVPKLNGPNYACPNQTKAYFVPAYIPGTISYKFYAPAGCVISDGVNAGNPLITGSLSVDVTFAPGFVSGNVSVSAIGPCEETAKRNITVRSVPSVTTIAGNSSVCPPQNGLIYSTPVITGVISYNWTVPSGMTITGNMNNAITVSADNTFTGGNICVSESYGCAASGSKCKGISLQLPAIPGSMSGTAYGVCGTEQLYTVPSKAGITYNWSANNGAMVTPSGNSATVNFTNANSYPVTVSVTASNACGTSDARSKSITGAPNKPGTITGPTLVCSGQQNAAYSIFPVYGADNYVWSVPNFASVNDGINTGNPSLTTTSTTVEVDWGNKSGNVTVKAINACGMSGHRGLAVTFNCRILPVENDNIKLHVFPNPASEYLNISFEIPSAGNVQIDIKDITGRIVKQQTATVASGPNQFRIDVSKLVAGLYSLNFYLGEINKAVYFAIEY